MKGATQYKHVYLLLSELRPHPDVQREFDLAWAEKIAKNFDPDVFGILDVIPNPNGDGLYYIFDGQHRAHAACMVLGTDQKVPCRLFPTLPVQRVAQLFRGKNNFKRPRYFDDFRIRLVEGEPIAHAIKGLLAKYKLHITDKAEPNGVRAVAACDAIYKRADGPGLLAGTLDVLNRAWAGNPDAYHQTILRGVAVLLRRHKGKAEPASLVRLLASRGSPLRLLGEARAMAKTMGFGAEEAVARRLVVEYNKRRSSGRLEERE